MESPFYWMLQPFKKFADFSGRARRMEYWMFVVMNIGISIVASLLDGLLGMSGMVAGLYGPLTLIAALALLIPGIAVAVRRLHDQNRTGWFLMLVIVPYVLMGVFFAMGNLGLVGMISIVALVCALGLLILMFLPGTAGDNQYGPDPKAGTGGPSTI